MYYITKQNIIIMKNLNKEDRIKSLIRKCTEELDTLQSVGNKWIMPNDLFRTVLKSMPHVEARWEQVWTRRDSLKRLLWKM